MPLAAAGETAALAAILTGRFISLHVGSPGNTGINEVTGGSYARVAGGTFSNTGSNPTSADNDADVTFAQASANWGTVTHFGVWSALTGGSFIGYGSLSVSKAVDLSDIARFLAGQLVVTCD